MVGFCGLVRAALARLRAVRQTVSCHVCETRLGRYDGRAEGLDAARERGWTVTYGGLGVCPDCEADGQPLHLL